MAPIANANLFVYGNYDIQHVGPTSDQAYLYLHLIIMIFVGLPLYSAFAGDTNQYCY